MLELGTVERVVAAPAGDEEQLGPLAFALVVEPDSVALCERHGNGEGRTRTGDTPVFSRVLYQLSYLAVRAAV